MYFFEQKDSDKIRDFQNYLREFTDVSRYEHSHGPFGTGHDMMMCIKKSMAAQQAIKSLDILWEELAS